MLLISSGWLLLLILLLLGAHVSCQPLTTDEKANVLNLHNQFRSDVAALGASDMVRMEWSAVLELTAQNYANKCVFQHNANRQSDTTTNAQNLGVSSAPYSSVGENIYWQSNVGGDPGGSAIKSFNSENASYTYTQVSSTNFAATGHYTQNIWSSSRYVGCAAANCQGTSLGGTFVVCDYAPAGNFIGSFPYAKGTPCSACSTTTYPYCVNNLCSTTNSAAANIPPTPTNPAPKTTSNAGGIAAGVLVSCAVVGAAGGVFWYHCKHGKWPTIPGMKTATSTTAPAKI